MYKDSNDKAALKAGKGVKFDNGKNQYELMPVEALEGVVKILTFGAQKYAPYNWMKVRPIYRYYGALLRHLEAVRKGEWLDQESGFPHLDHAMCNLIFLRELLKDKTEKELIKVFQGGDID